MRKDTVDYYSNHVLIPIEAFIKQEEANLYKQNSLVTDEQLKILQKANDMFYEKLETFCLLCDKVCQERETNNKNKDTMKQT